MYGPLRSARVCSEDTQGISIRACHADIDTLYVLTLPGLQSIRRKRLMHEFQWFLNLCRSVRRGHSEGKHRD